MALTVSLLNGNEANFTAKDVSGAFQVLASNGVFNTSLASTDFKVIESTPAAMSVDVSSGSAYVGYTKGSETWKVIVANSASSTLNIAANSSGLNRVDAIIIHLLQTSPNALKTNVAELRVVLGSGVAALADGAITASIGDSNWYRLADITVPDSAITIVTGDIADTRSLVAIEGVVNTTGNQTISGVKTFSSFPVGPNANPTTALQFANKQYVDAALAGGMSPLAKEDISIVAPNSNRGAVAWSSTSNRVENLVVSQFVNADAGTAISFETGSGTLLNGCKACTNKTVKIYQESSKWYVIAGITPAAGKDTVYGVRQEICATSANVLPGATYVSDNLVVFTYVTSANTLKARAASFTDDASTVFVFDTEYAVHAATVNSCSVSTVDTNKVLIAFNDSATFGRMSIGTLAAGVLTVDTANEQSLFAANAISQISVCKATTAKGFVFFRDDTSQDGTQVAISCGSTTPAGGAAVVVDANDCTSGECSQITTDKVLVAWYDATSQVVNARIASIAGTVVTNPTAEFLVYSSVTVDSVRCLAYSTSNAIITFRDGVAIAQKLQDIYISGTTLSFKAGSVSYITGATSADRVKVVSVNDNNKLLFTYGVTATGDLYSRVYQGYDNTTMYAGIAQGTYAAGDTVSIKQNGADTNQVGLTPGQPITAQGILVGKAITSTSMEITVGPAKSYNLDSYCVDISNTDDYVFNNIPSTPIEGQQYNVKFLTANTGACTANGLAIKKIDGNDTVTGDITANMPGTLRCNGTNYTLMSPTITALSATGTGTAAGGGITQNVDVVITTGFRPSLVEVSYYLIGYASGAQKVTIGTVNFNSSLAISGGIQLLNNVAIATPVDGNTLSTTPTLQAGGVAGSYSTTVMSLFAISDTGFTLRFAFVDGGIGGAYSQTYAYKAWK